MNIVLQFFYFVYWAICPWVHIFYTHRNVYSTVRLRWWKTSSWNVLQILILMKGSYSQ